MKPGSARTLSSNSFHSIRGKWNARLFGNCAQMAHSTTWWNILNIVWSLVMGHRDRRLPMKSHHTNASFTSPQIWLSSPSLLAPITMLPPAPCWRFLKLARLYLLSLPVYSCFHYLECLPKTLRYTPSGQGSSVCSRVGLPGFKSWLPHLVVVWLWTCCFTSPCLCWVNCKMSIVRI